MLEAITRSPVTTRACQIFLMSVFTLGLSPRQAEARIGDWGEPILIDATPFAHASSTQPRRPSQVNRYSCASQLDESGPEVVYQLNVTQSGVINARVDGDNGVVDIDLHLLDRAQLVGGQAEGCITRNNLSFVQSVSPGTYLIVVDTYAGAAQAGAYTLQVQFEPYGEWYQRPVANGVTLETRRYDALFGGNQFGSVLRVDLNAPGVEVKPVRANGCQTTSQLGRSSGAVAAINGGYFDGSCGSVSLLKIDGVLYSSNARSRSAFGVTAQGAPMIDWIPSGQDWPEARQALGGLSRLSSAGAVDVQWERDSATSGFTYGANPRTAVGIGSGGELILATLDGRTSAGAGASLFDFGQWLVWLGAMDSLNLDGGGSTTLWVKTEGVVNYPSDNGYADHQGERGVSNILAVFAPPLSREVEWEVSAGAYTVDVDETITFEVFARDPDGLPVSLSAMSTGRGLVNLQDRGDGSALLAYTGHINDPSQVTLSIQASAGGRADGSWNLMIDVRGSQGVFSGGGAEAGTEAGLEAGAEAGTEGGSYPMAGEMGPSGGSPYNGGEPAGGSGPDVEAGSSTEQSAGSIVEPMAGAVVNPTGGTEAMGGSTSGGEVQGGNPRVSMGREPNTGTAGSSSGLNESESSRGVSCEQGGLPAASPLWLLLLILLSRRRARLSEQRLG